MCVNVHFDLPVLTGFDNREESPTYGTKLVFRMGNTAEHPEANTVLVKIPQGVLHGGCFGWLWRMF